MRIRVRMSFPPPNPGGYPGIPWDTRDQWPAGRVSFQPAILFALQVQTGELRNLTKATTLIRQLPAVIHYLNNSEPPRLGKHIGLYLQLFLPKCGIRFCETDRYLVGQVASTTGSPSTCTSSISPKLHSRPRRAVVKERQPKPASRPRRKPRSFPAALDTPSEHSGSLSPVPTPRLIPSHCSNDNIPRDIQPKDDPASSAKSPSTNGHRLLVLSIG
ncbi:Histone-lysine N-methyltransferase set9 [Puccinia graminis f. sp. tritici]|uniref:Histone-lysine N-methyltransferase set9 n=1 Tax=Puccinia graminis f. sp. tritici TaxID=56615 RepID=A0A5B0P5S4_PUCGR|nr:Histone-lysine N-methyltransferase set9 [Puccinia graminis f. sp. tritici]